LKLEKYIDHTILKPDTTADAVRQVCTEAKTHGFYSVCVNPYYVPLVKEELAGSEVKITSVVGFPLGNTTKEAKAFETKQAIASGADEIDMVINIAAVKNAEWDLVESDIRAVVEALSEETKLKVILETCLLTEEEKVRACQVAKAAGAHFVKTSTGFSSGGATVEDIQLMRKTVGPEMGVKASGGVRDAETAVAMIAAGATRIGASSSVAIVGGGRGTDDY
jgi:deoxyribose-phosphate aldolase